jgi:hypothetical protein
MRTTRVTVFFFALVAVFLATAPVSAQPAAKTVGLRANWQDGSSGISVPLWMNSNFVLEPSLDIAHVSDIGTDIGAGIFLRHNLKQARMTPYIGFRFLGFFFSPDEGDATADYVYGPAVGGEYFLAESFSISVEAQLHYAQSDEASHRFANPDGTNIGTATTVSAAIYF